MIPRPAAYLTVLLATTVLSVRAEDLAQSSEALCEKVKACALAQMNEEDLTPETRQMMQPMLDNMCANLSNQISQVPPTHPHYAPALACMRSMENLGCEDMMSEERLHTPECEQYRQLAQESGADD